MVFGKTVGERETGLDAETWVEQTEHILGRFYLLCYIPAFWVFSFRELKNMASPGVFLPPMSLGEQHDRQTFY